MSLVRLGASVSTLGSGTTVPASNRELELQAKLAAAQALIASLTQGGKEKGSAGDARDGDERDSAYRRMDAELWDQPILQDSFSIQQFYCFCSSRLLVVLFFLAD